MKSVQTARDVLTDDSLRVALLLGLVTVPATVILSWETVSSDVYAIGLDARAEPVLIGALVAGYYYSTRETGAKRVGIAVGLAASLSAVILIVANTAVTLGSLAPVWAGVALVATGVLTVFGAGLLILIAIIGAIVGDKIGSRVRRWRSATSPRSL